MIASRGASARLNSTPTIQIGASDKHAPRRSPVLRCRHASAVASTIRARAASSIAVTMPSTSRMVAPTNVAPTTHRHETPATLSIDQFASSHIDPDARGPDSQCHLRQMNERRDRGGTHDQCVGDRPEHRHPHRCGRRADQHQGECKEIDGRDVGVRARPDPAPATRLTDEQAEPEECQHRPVSFRRSTVEIGSDDRNHDCDRDRQRADAATVSARRSGTCRSAELRGR